MKVYCERNYLWIQQQKTIVIQTTSLGWHSYYLLLKESCRTRPH